MSHKVPTHGNYHGQGLVKMYYSKRPSALSDPRLQHIPPNTFIGARVLDVGCNEGWVTCEIAQVWGASRVVGVDIDESLVEGAWRRRRTLWTLQSPDAHKEPTAPQPEGINEGAGSHDDEPPKKKRKRGKANSAADAVTGSKDDPTKPGAPPDALLRAERALKARNHFPASCEHEFGSLPIPHSDLRGKGVFPHNVSFRCADWVNTEIVEDSAGYDAVVAFSITKWIHLNTLDSGLTSFFQKVHRVLRAGGVFILEPQPWDSYAKARRMSETLKENAKKLELRPEGFRRMLEEIGFKHQRRVEVGKGGFARPIDLYVKL